MTTPLAKHKSELPPSFDPQEIFQIFTTKEQWEIERETENGVKNHVSAIMNLHSA